MPMPKRTPSKSPNQQKIRTYREKPRKAHPRTNFSPRNTNFSPKTKFYDAKMIYDHEVKVDKDLDDRCYPRRDVIHYESPPRRRLRMAEDDAIEEYHQSKFPILNLASLT